MIRESRRKLKIPKVIYNNAVNIVQAAKNRAKKENSITDMALIFRAHFLTWKAADEALQLPTGLLYGIGSGRVKDSPMFRRAIGLMPKEDPRHDYRPRFSPTFMAAVLASPEKQQELLVDLLAEFEKRVRP
mgnify:CR=1 FL=1